MRRMTGTGVVWGVAAAVLACLQGCGSRSETPPPRRDEAVRAVPVVPPEVRKQLLDGAVSVLRRLDDFDEAAAYEQVFDRLNQWSHSGVAEVPWEPDPLIDELSERFRQSVPAETLAGSTFDAVDDPMFLRDQRWLADLAASIRQDAVDDLDIAERLFTWTVRSLALVSDPPMQSTAENPGNRWLRPGEILLAGRASAAQRSWIFLQLLRHAGLQGVMLATQVDEEQAGSTLVPWVPAVIADGEAWLFDPAYGMPIPGPGGEGIASARQAFEDPAILAAMDLEERRYPVRAEDVGRLGVLVAASPADLSRRMLLVERSLVGSNAMSLAVDPAALVSAAATTLPRSDGEVPAGLWTFPWESERMRKERNAEVQAQVARELAPLTVQLPEPAGDGPPRLFRPLFTARVREFRGELDGRSGAKFAYLAARPSESRIRGFMTTMPPAQADALRRLVGQMKEDATYYLGVVTLGEGEYEAAIDFLDRMTLQENPDSRWADAARINVAVAYAAAGQPEVARRLLEADESPQRFGSRLLARTLPEASGDEDTSP